MKFCLRIVFLLFLVSGILTDDGFDLGDALLDDLPTEAPKKPPKAPEKPKTDAGELDLLDAFGDDLTPTKKPEKPKKPSSGGFDGLDLEDALGPDPNPKTEKPAVKPPKSGDGGKLDDSDLFDVAGGDYKPDGGKSGGRAQDFDNNQGGADQPQEAGSGQIAGIASAIGVALLGAASSYFAYQKKKLCFKLQGGQDPEMGKGQGTHSDPQVLSNLLRTQ